MMRWLVRASLRFRLLIIPLAAALLVLGAVRLKSAPRDVLPEFTAPRVEVQTEALGLSATEVEQLITVPLESDLLNGVAWLDDINSESVPGLSSIEMIFEPGTDVFRARQMVQERLTQAHALPNVSSPPVMLQPLSSTNRVMMVGLTAKDLSLTEMSVLARWVVKPRLTGVPGVANVSVWGHRERQLQVQVDPEKLRANGVTLNQVVSTAGNSLWVSPLTFLEASTPGTGGFIDTPNQRLGIQHILPIRTPEDLAQVTIEDQASGKRLRLGDVATVVEDHQPLIGDALVSGGPGLMLVVEKFPNADTVEVSRGVEAALESLRPGLTGIQVDSEMYRPATFIDHALGNVGLAALLGLVLLALVLILLLWEWRAALITFLAVVLSVALAWVVLSLAGYGLTFMLIAGVLVGLVFAVADAVGDTMHLSRRLRERRIARRDTGQEISAGRTILDAALEVRGPMTYATLIILVAAAPLLLLPELTGLFFRPLVLAFVAVVLASSLVSLTFTPAMAAVLLREAPLERHRSPVLSWWHRVYADGLAAVLRGPALVYGLAGLVLLGGAVALLQPLAQSAIPALRERNLLVQWDAVPGTSAQEMTRVTERASQELRAIPGVRDVGAHLGRAIASDQVVNVDSGELWVTLEPGAHYDRTRQAVSELVASYPGLDTDVVTYPEQRITQLLSGADDAIVVRVYGQDLNVLKAKAVEVRDLLGGIDGVVNPQADLPVEQPTVQVKVDLAKAQQAGLKPGDVRRAAATMLSGIQVGNLFEDQKVFEVVVWGTPEVRNSLSGVRDLMINTPSGGQVRLGDVADVNVVAGPNVIERDSVSRYIDVSAGIKARDYRAVVQQVDDRLEHVSFPLEHHAELLGAYEHRIDDQNRLLLAAFAALVLIFLLLQAAVGSWLLSTLLFLTLPVAVAGGLVAGAIGSQLTAISSLAAFIAIAGLSLRMVLQQVKHAQRLERGTPDTPGLPFGPELVARAAAEQAGPLLVSVVATAAALLPVLLLGWVAGLEVLRPIVWVLLAGLVVALLLALFVVPALYLRFGRDSLRDELSLPAEPQAI
ncbi:efflux RND transporter permease subunit [Catellatospora tritici]|uniref:efflux RND transporter permease subunit n=1 Tax=Catellatospora tritici TaxID=2851566 RepID=UPI001C2D5C2C|nr:efflux RND transporter permease subunit [Catellatospora tritici]MBV1852421.1 efflux RND transporter permease subunit [Catellatospora tritici]